METTTPVIARQTRDAIDKLPSLADELLRDVENKAARDFTAYTLHAKRPTELQGDRDARSWAIRKEIASAAEALWLAVQAERDRRREAGR